MTMDAGPERVRTPRMQERSPGRVSGRASFEARLLRRLLIAMGEPPVEFVLWDGERVTPAATPQATVTITDRAALFALLRDPQMRLGDGYTTGQIRIEGDLVQLMLAIYRSGAATGNAGFVTGRLAEWMHRPRRNSVSGSRDNIHHHYDLGNDFYRLWLGDTMAYTCAYFPAADATLNAAQVAKMDHVCRKLRLKAGETVVEAGCGWGSLALHMARHYGVRVRAFNISREQLEYARDQARLGGLGERVEFVEDDYRSITGRYDVFASIGMLEHVGRENYAELGRVVRGCIGDRGRGLIHSIGRNRPEPLHPWIERRIFPGAYAPSLGEMMQIFEPWELSVLDVENIRLHYALTLRHWLAQFEAASTQVARMFDENFVRMWRLYLAGSIAGFETGALQLFQVLFTTRDNNDLPLTRQFMYPAGP